MVGGGPRLSPGEVTLADQGVLVCDELPEFGRDVLEALRQPLEEGSVSRGARRAAGDVPGPLHVRGGDEPVPVRPAWIGGPRLQLPAGGPERYLRRVSGPLRDRIDLWVAMDRVPPAVLLRGSPPEPSASVAVRIAAARDRQRARPGAAPNGRLGGPIPP